MPSLLDIMAPEDREAVKAISWQKHSRSSKESKMPPDIRLIAELGSYFGWPAIEAAKRGYVEVSDNENGKKHQIPLTMDEIAVLVEGAKKNRASFIIDIAYGIRTAVASALSEHPNPVMKNGLKQFYEKAQ